MSLFGKNKDDEPLAQDTTGARPRNMPRGQGRDVTDPGPVHPARRPDGDSMANIGKSIQLKGDLTGNEDLVIEGNIEGRIDLPNNQLTVGAEGKIKAEIHAKDVIVVGHVSGNVSAVERIEVQASGVIDGDVSAPRLIVQEGAVLNGSIQMNGGKASTGQSIPKPAPTPSPKPNPNRAGEAA